MFKFYSGCDFSGHSSFNWVGVLSALISVISLCCTLYFIYLGKRIELLSLKFQKFCIQNLDQIFKTLDGKFTHSTPAIRKIKKDITNISTDVQTFILTLKRIYPSIQTQELIGILEDFTDSAYSTGISDSEVKNKYFTMKVELYEKLYDFAMKKELSLFYRLGIKK